MLTFIANSKISGDDNTLELRQHDGVVLALRSLVPHVGVPLNRQARTEGKVQVLPYNASAMWPRVGHLAAQGLPGIAREFAAGVLPEGQEDGRRSGRRPRREDEGVALHERPSL